MHLSNFNLQMRFFGLMLLRTYLDFTKRPRLENGKK